MIYNKLIELLSLQKNKLADLLESLKLMQRSIVHQQYIDFEETINSYQKILSDIRNIEKERIRLMNTIVPDFKNNTKFSLPDSIFESLNITDNIEKQKYLDLRNKIAELINEVTKYNFQNMYLIEHSRKFIKDMVITLYGSKNQKILDKKA